MTDMQLKYMKTAAEVPNIQANTAKTWQEVPYLQAQSKKLAAETPRLAAQSAMAKDYLDHVWKTQLDAEKLGAKANYYRNLAERELTRYHGEWWDNNGQGRGWANHNWWNPYTNSAGVGRTNFNAVAKGFSNLVNGAASAAVGGITGGVGKAVGNIMFNNWKAKG